MRFPEAFSARYDVKSVLGEGGMGRVLLAEDRQLGRAVAIKLLAEFDDGPDGPLRQRFTEEARVCAGFKHPNIVRLLSFDFFPDGKPYMVFELIAGEDVAKRLEKQRTLPVPEVLAIAEAVLAGLQYAHDHRVIHRDVKPGNIILRAEGGDAMLTDFGVAKAQTGRTFKTQTNLILGTPLYMAPELIRREAVGPGVDIYALGCTLYECLTGQPPFTGKSDVMVLEKHLNEAAPPLREVRADVPPDVELLIERAMHKDPERRFRAARDMAGWVDTIRSGGRVPQAKTNPVTYAPVTAGARTRSEHRGRGAPSRNTQVTSEGTSRGTTVLETPSGISRRARRTAAVALAVLLGAALGAYGWHHAGGQPSGVHAAFGPDGLEIAWHTAQPARGAIYHGPLDEAAVVNPDGTLDRPPPHARMTRVDEDAAAVEHRVLLAKLRPGDRVVVSLATSTGESSWARAMLVPPVKEARQTPPEPGATSTRVTAATGRVRSARLEAWTAAGEPLVIAPAIPDAVELSFDVPLPPDQLDDRTRVVAEQLPGVTQQMPVLTMRRAAARLVEAVERADPKQLISRLVKDPNYDVNADFPNMLAETPMIEMPKEVARRKSAEGYFLQQVRRSLEERGVLQPLEEFRPFANAFFAGGVPDDQKLRAYEALLELEPLDALIRGQLDAEHQLEIQKVFSGLVHLTYTLPAPDAPPAAPPPGAVSVLPGGQGWATDDYDMWRSLIFWCNGASFFRNVIAQPQPDAVSIHTFFLPRRSYALSPLPGAGGAGLAQLKAEVCILGSNFHYDVVLRGGARTFRVRLAQPGRPDWRQAMDDAGNTGPHSPYGEIVAEFPAHYLPTEDLKVEVEYRHLPGVRMAQINAVPRASLIRSLTLAVK